VSCLLLQQHWLAHMPCLGPLGPQVVLLCCAALLLLLLPVLVHWWIQTLHC
jgi:hypothetical protein